jgi:hypothetical protein
LLVSGALEGLEGSKVSRSLLLKGLLEWNTKHTERYVLFAIVQCRLTRELTRLFKGRVEPDPRDPAGPL